MKQLLTSFFLLLIWTTTAYTQADLTQTIISEETGLVFSLPEDWTAEFYSAGRSTLILQSSNNVQLEVFSPATLIGDRLDHPQKANELLASMMELYEWDIGDFETQTINDQILTIGSYQIGSFDGILVGIPLGNNEYAVIDTIDWAKSRDTDLVIEIASTFERLSPLVLKNHAGPWQSAVNELEGEGVIGVGGGIIFIEGKSVV